MKIGYIIAAVFMLLVACTGPQVEQVVPDETMEDVTVEQEGEDATVTVETDEGETTLEVDAENTDEWCQTGSTWKMSGTEGQAEMKIVGLETTGKYAGYCHVTYDIDAEGAQGQADFYFNKDGDGYQVMTMNGQKFEQEWTG